MKILFATGIFPPDIGGPATYVEKLASVLHEQNFAVEVVTYFDGGKITSQTANKNYNFRITRISRKIPWGIKHIIYFLSVLRLAKSSNVIYVQNATSTGFPATFASRILHKKLILKIVGDAAWERARSKGLTEDTIDMFQSKHYGFGIGFLKKIQKYVAGNADKIIVPSIYLKNIVREWGIDGGKIYVIYNALEPAEPRGSVTKEDLKQKTGLEGDVILSVGRLVPWKGFGELIEIMPYIIRYNPRFRLVIVGEGPLREDLQLKITGLGLDGKVKLAGSIEHGELFFYFRAADIFVLNSSYEGLSHVLLEAMMAGVPVIATNVGGNPEVIEDGTNGFLVEHNNAEELQEKIFRLWGDKELQSTFITNSREKLKQFSFYKMVAETINVLTI